MTAQQTGTPMELADPEVDPTTERWVERRASQLCLQAEPHTGEPPCPAHLNEANRQLLGPC